MNREKAMEAAEVMIAYAQKKPIQIFNPTKGLWEDLDSDNIGFDWSVNIFRVKTEPKLVPFTFEDRELFLGKTVAHKDPIAMYCSLILACDYKSVQLGNEVCDYQRLLDEYKFIYGSPCGKIVEE